VELEASLKHDDRFKYKRSNEALYELKHDIDNNLIDKEDPEYKEK